MDNELKKDYSISNEISNLNKLKEEGILSEEEFLKAKNNLITNNKTSLPIFTQNKRFTTGVLALFLGGLGLHHFYTGHKIYGIIYLLFCWTLIPSILAFIEGIVYLMMSDETFNTKHDATHPNYKKSKTLLGIER